jgi:hypothetical protein
MHEVYSQSYCTIAASASSDSSQGLFRNRATHFLYPSEIDIPWFHGTKKFQLLHRDLWDTQVLHQPLHRRGWVLQERLLAPRVLHFSSQQLVWECRKLVAAEKYPKGLPPFLSRSANALFKNMDPHEYGAYFRELGDEDRDPKTFVYDLWEEIVRVYSSSLLTFSDDKLVALSGIAKQLQDKLNDRYIAGLWMNFLPSQLLWQVLDCR